MDIPEEDPSDEQLVELAIEYATYGVYPSGLSKDKKEHCIERHSTLVAKKGEVFAQRCQRKGKVVIDKKEQEWIVHASHADPASGHFNATNTWRWVAERLYCRGMSSDVKALVSSTLRKQCMYNSL